MRINDILELGESEGASDIHFTVGFPPILRVDGELVITDLESLTRESSRALIYSMLNDERKASFEKNRELDFS
ncbi:MAG: type IV pili twitching motility protein PilT, partial [Candidatus Omnitrophica bacterium]|nr:type IV pili twitching motility protein PilT [Candidatus Omnitrophota bacterium]